MKRFLSLLLLLCIIPAFTGCRYTNQNNGINFYYLRSEFQYHSAMGTLKTEFREISTDQLDYILKVYLLGPSSDGTQNPFPNGTKLKQVAQENTAITVELELGNSISDSMFTVGASCIALTCFDFTDAEAVTVTADKHTLTVKKDTILLSDALK